jgi:UDP-N-acetyl-2-amino-2-deoxyglucuronate dehydrogenase
MPKTINVAIIGCGIIHHVHKEVVGRLDNVRLAAVCDDKPERAQASAGESGCLSYTDYREMLKSDEVTAVHVCTPHWLHGSMALDALRAGKYVLLEKPMATTVAQAEALMAEDGRQGGNRLCVVFQNRYNDSVKMLRDIIADGRYGVLQSMRGSVAWHRAKEYYADDWHGKKELECGGVMINQAIHTLDLVQWLCGGAQEIKGSVSTDALAGVVEVEDSAHMFIRMKSSISAVFYGTVAHGADSPVEIEAVFEKATLLMRGDTLLRIDGGFEVLCNPESSPLWEKGYWGRGHLAQIGDFYSSIEQGKPFYIDGRQGIEAVKLVCGLYESSRTGKAVRI